MPTATLYLTGLGTDVGAGGKNYTKAWVGLNNYTVHNDESDGTYMGYTDNYCNGGYAADYFSYTADSFSASYTSINSVTLTARLYMGYTPTPTPMNVYCEVGSTRYNGSSVNCSNQTWTNVSNTWTTNPAGGNWTAATIAAMDWGYFLRWSSCTQSYASYLRITVDYNAASTHYTPDALTPKMGLTRSLFSSSVLKRSKTLNLGVLVKNLKKRLSPILISVIGVRSIRTLKKITKRIIAKDGMSATIFKSIRSFRRLSSSVGSSFITFTKIARSLRLIIPAIVLKVGPYMKWAKNGIFYNIIIIKSVLGVFTTKDTKAISSRTLLVLEGLHSIAKHIRPFNRAISNHLGLVSTVPNKVEGHGRRLISNVGYLSSIIHIASINRKVIATAGVLSYGILAQRKKIKVLLTSIKFIPTFFLAEADKRFLTARIGTVSSKIAYLTHTYYGKLKLLFKEEEDIK